MKAAFASAGLALLMAACNSNTPGIENQEENALAQQDTTSTSGEWISLLDGQSLQHWHSYGQETTGSAWKVEDGVLYLDTTGTAAGGDLVTEQEFEDFHLQLEWKIGEGGNSGIMFYVQEDTSKYPEPYNTGPEMQILHNEGHPDGKIIKHRAGDLYDLITATPEAAKPVGEWNQVEVISRDNQLQFVLNGQNVVTTTLWDDNWRQMIANSKFKDMEGFGTFQEGKIALQDHGDPVWFRNIRIKRL
ncbi:DUF1080 domain-containing protein [Cesiribacter sp. SM1]|uniref:3-keto-disaccharide hydrolase n=1 Tax=Cesiribacter sp. SM1 TaxID=2861196 RepID=UPI001CD31377|nr:DUF1080 domain-containing protein [Cesiribacter sp. SM1]